MRIRRGRPIQCAAVESKETAADHARVLDNSSLLVRGLEYEVCVYRSRNKPTYCRANWSGDGIAIATSQRWTFLLRSHLRVH